MAPLETCSSQCHHWPPPPHPHPPHPHPPPTPHPPPPPTPHPPPSPTAWWERQVQDNSSLGCLWLRHRVQWWHCYQGVTQWVTVKWAQHGPQFTLLMYSSMASGNSLTPVWLHGGKVCWITPWKLIGKPNSRKSIASWSWKPLAKSSTAATFMAVLTGALHPLKFGKPDNFTRACNWMLRCTSGQYLIGVLGLGWNSAAWGFRLREFTVTGSTAPRWHPLTSHLLPW